MKSPSSVKAFTVATSPPFCVEVGRITEQRDRFLLMKLQGSARILLVWVSSLARIVEIRESEPGKRIGHANKRRVHLIPRLILPEPEGINFDSANRHQDPQPWRVGCLQRQRRIERRPTLLNN